MGVKHRWRRRRITRRPIPDSVWAGVTAQMPQLAGLDTTQLDRLRAVATLFLQDKVFHGVEGVVPAETRVAVAAHAGLMVMALDYDLLKGWTTVVMYDGGFSARHEVVDEAGVVHTEDTDLSGEAWEGGPLVLSREDVHVSVTALDGFNLVVHELAHKLDMLNGDANGYPPLPPEMRASDWSAAFTGAFDDLGERERLGAPLPLDPYALENPAEFFAVASEAFFEVPAVLWRAYPAVHDCLRGYYRQDTLRRLG